MVGVRWLRGFPPHLTVHQSILLGGSPHFPKDPPFSLRLFPKCSDLNLCQFAPSQLCKIGALTSPTYHQLSHLVRQLRSHVVDTCTPFSNLSSSSHFRTGASASSPTTGCLADLPTVEASPLCSRGFHLLSLLCHVPPTSASDQSRLPIHSLGLRSGPQAPKTWVTSAHGFPADASPLGPVLLSPDWLPSLSNFPEQI